MASQKSFRVKRSKADPIVFSYEIELDPDDDDTPAKPQTPDELAEEALEKAAEGDEKPVTSFKVGTKTYPFSEILTETDGQVERHWFRARPSVPGAILLDLVGAGVHVNQGYQAAALRSFLDTAIDKRDRARFESFLTDSEPPVEITDLQGVVEFLTDHYNNEERPTARPAR